MAGMLGFSIGADLAYANSVPFDHISVTCPLLLT